MVCPVGGIGHYFHDAKLYGTDLSAGYLFRPVMGSMKVQDDCVSYSAIYERLKTYLSILGIDDDETPHSMRAGCAVTFALTGSVETKGVMDHIGWFSKRSADYYSRSSKLIDSGNVANALAKSVNSAKAVEMNLMLNADFNNVNRLCDSSC